MTLRFSNAVDTPVYTRDSADEIGRVVQYLVDADRHAISAVHISGRKRDALLADWDHVVGFGPDAVVVDTEASLRHPDEGYEQEVARGKLPLKGRRVLTDSGFEVGELVDVEFDESSGLLSLIETNHTTVDGAGLRTIGPYAVIVRHDAVRPTGEPPVA